MKLASLCTAFVLLLAVAGCGSDDSSDEGDSDGAAQAQAAVQGQIDAFADRDFEKVCDLQDAEGVKGMTALMKTDTCPEAFAKVFKNQNKLQSVGKNPVDAYVEELQDYKVGEATPIDDPELEPNDWQVELIGPKDATAYVVEEDGEFLVRELFNTLGGSDAPSDPSDLQPPG